MILNFHGNTPERLNQEENVVLFPSPMMQYILRVHGITVYRARSIDLLKHVVLYRVIG